MFPTVSVRLVDLGFGTTGMALDDYPFACLCDAEGKCAGDTAETTCAMRPGQNGAKSVVVPFLGIALAALL